MRFLYWLTDPDTGRVRWVGQTNDPSRRLRMHLLNFARGADADKRVWIKTLQAAGSAPRMTVLAQLTDEDVSATERRLIRLLVMRGAPLLNKRGKADG